MFFFKRTRYQLSITHVTKRIVVQLPLVGVSKEKIRDLNLFSPNYGIYQNIYIYISYTQRAGLEFPAPRFLKKQGFPVVINRFYIFLSFHYSLSGIPHNKNTDKYKKKKG